MSELVQSIENNSNNTEMICQDILSTNTQQNGTVESSSVRNLGYVDVHCHLIHEKFVGMEDMLAMKCINMGLDHVIVNGLEPISNRAILEYCAKYTPHLLPAAGIYPLDAACNVITPDIWKHDFEPPARFDVDAEIDFIDQLANQKRIIAIGECGLDKHYLNDNVSMAEQERVLRRLMKLGVKHNLPLILHTRKAEQRVLDMLIEEKVPKADFHCFCGKAKLGAKIAAAGYYLSIPSHIVKNDSSFRKLVEVLPIDKILTETDSPYMGPVKGKLNDPTTVIQSIDVIAQIKQLSPDAMRSTVRNNFQTLFSL